MAVTRALTISISVKVYCCDNAKQASEFRHVYSHTTNVSAAGGHSARDSENIFQLPLKRRQLGEAPSRFAVTQPHFAARLRLIVNKHSAGANGLKQQDDGNNRHQLLDHKRPLRREPKTKHDSAAPDVQQGGEVGTETLDRQTKKPPPTT